MKIDKGIFLSICLAAFTSCILICGIVYYFIDHTFLDKLFLYKIGNFPLILIIFVAIIIISIVYSTAVLSTIRHNEKALLKGLTKAENGIYHKETEQPIRSIDNEIELKIQKISKQIEDSRKTVQKLVDEKKLMESQTIEDVVTKERHRLARELHDSVSQQLFAISMMISAINELGETTFKEQLQYIEKMAINAQSEMRALLLHLRPVQLEGKSLKEGVEKLLTELTNRQALQLKWKIDDISLSKGVEDHLFRIIQEALSNTLRHAKAKTFEIRIRKIEDFVLVRMIDDGIGFNVENRKTGSYGLQSISERSSEVGGTAKIVSIPNRGTQIEVKIPVIE
ncbi:MULTISPECIES: sensor histidine kinase [unclassified Bacillus (in: firmicutes)]|uniref:sensor histidine kinase n=1 Tax=unclassified Bacillus (in: firmicutes) TaxID=185979 RepID=UPI000BEFBC75|nr:MULTISPECIES: sensor histidine kinase [unclassified Bacillus (in: firmicutes)]PEJ57274.1 two-component sensor histidine kinase [Bacillus sp. AFS002410]PEL13266.1 two-component sensor histidine kinase [Bacillus sp. AFS017336]